MATSFTSVAATANVSTSSHDQNKSATAIPSRPTTPLRPPSRTSLRASQTTPTAGGALGSSDIPLNSLQPAFEELSDSMADLEANFMHLQLLNESLNRFNENFGAFLYGMNMSAFCVDFPEAPIPQSFNRSPFPPPTTSTFNVRGTTPGLDTEATFMTSDTSFIEHPPTSSKKSQHNSTISAASSSKYSSIPPSTATAARRAAAAAAAATPSRNNFSARGRGAASGTGRGGVGAGAARGSTVGRGGVSGIARGVRGRGSR